MQLLHIKCLNAISSAHN